MSNDTNIKSSSLVLTQVTLRLQLQFTNLAAEQDPAYGADLTLTTS